ncbi:MAG: DUF2279 domain-containing protein [Bacteroidota bacterium]
MIRFIAVFFFLAGANHSLLAGDDGEKDTTFLTLQRKDVATYGTIAWSAGAVFMEFQWWWKDDYFYRQHAFRFQNDGYFYNTSYGVDKLGHMYASYLIFHLTYDVMKWAHYDDGTALWAAVAVPASHALAIEIADGFSKWAFNMSDLYFNTAGIVYGALQTEYPFLRNFNYKWSYFPSASGGRDDPDWGPASDYGGHIYWISANVHNLLPEPAQKYWPRFLNVAVGMGAKNVSYGDTGTKKHKFAVSLDWNMNEILPDGDTWGVFKNLIDKVRFPAPGIKMYSGEEPQGKLLLVN